MAVPPHGPWEPVPDTPRRRLGRAGARDLVLVLPFLALALVGGVLVGRVLGLPLLVAAAAVRPALLVATGSTPGFRRQHIRLVRVGGGPPGVWRPFAWQGVHLLLPVLLFVLVDTSLWPVAFVPWAALLAIGWWRGRALGPGAEPELSLVGLDVAEAGEAPTPSGTSGPPAGGPPTPTPAAPATPGPAPRRGTPAPR